MPVVSNAPVGVYTGKVLESDGRSQGEENELQINNYKLSEPVHFNSIEEPILGQQVRSQVHGFL